MGGSIRSPLVAGVLQLLHSESGRGDQIRRLRDRCTTTATEPHTGSPTCPMTARFLFWRTNLPSGRERERERERSWENGSRPLFSPSEKSADRLARPLPSLPPSRWGLILQIGIAVPQSREPRLGQGKGTKESLPPTWGSGL